MKVDFEWISKEMNADGSPFLIVVFDAEANTYEYRANLTDDGVAEIFGLLIRDYGADLLDRVIDRILDDNETEWPRTID